LLHEKSNLGPGLLLVYTLLQSSEDKGQRTMATAYPAGEDLIRGPRGKKQIRRAAYYRAEKIRRSDADYKERSAVQDESLSYDRRVKLKPTLPVCVTNHGRRLAVCFFIILFAK
jgi:hypothetical protein